MPGRRTEGASGMTIDQLAASVRMTVRNVRAYAGRGLIPKPRLVGRTAYYDDEHVARLRLIQSLVARGYTLGAVEKAIDKNPSLAAGHALEMLDSMGGPLGEAPEPEDMTLAELAELSGAEQDEGFLQHLVEAGLVDRVGPDRVRLLRPHVVRAGAQAMSLGLTREAVLDLLPLISEHLHVIAQRFVDGFREQLWRPFVEAGLPEEEWPAMVSRMEAILPVAGQTVVAMFRDELRAVVEEAMGEEIAQMASGAASAD